MKKIILIILIIFLSGCYNYTEINNLVLVNGIYIDYKDNSYSISLDIDKTVSANGTTLADAFRNVNKTLSKKAYYAHLKILLISTEVLNNHLDDVVYYFLRNNEIRNNFYVLVSDNISKIDSTYIKSKVKNNEDIAESCLFKNILIKYLDKKEILLPVISDEQIAGSIIKNDSKTTLLDINESRLLRIIKNTHPNTIYKNLNIYKSKVKKIKNILYVSLDAELIENSDEDIKKSLKNDIKELYKKIYNKEYKNIFITIDINRNGQILNE